MIDQYKSKITLLLICILAALLLYQKGLSLPPSLPFKIIDGRQLTLEQYHGKPVLIDFWSTSCRSCLEEMPALISLYKELSTEGFEIIGVAMPYDRPDHVLQVVEKYKIPYPIALDLEADLVRAFGNVSVTPTHFLIGPEGQILDQHHGSIDTAKLRLRIQKLLAKKVS